MSEIFNKDQILRPYRFNLKYAFDLVSDIDDKLMYQSPTADLLQYLQRSYQIVEKRILSLDNNKSAEPYEWRFTKHFSTVGDMLMFMCITHEAMHLAQVAAWRRSFGLESSLARL